jgi:hypothetical protein
MSATLNPVVPDLPVFRLCIKCGEVFDEDEMAQCVDCDAFMCSQHVCDCPFEGRIDEDAA